jgi:hypothetical protein
MIPSSNEDQEMTNMEKKIQLKILGNSKLQDKYQNIHLTEDVSLIKIKVQKVLWLYLSSCLKIFSFILVFAFQPRPPTFFLNSDFLDIKYAHQYHQAQFLI